MYKTIIGMLSFILFTLIFLTVPTVQKANSVITNVHVAADYINLSKIPDKPVDKPIRIVIPSVDINLNIIESEIQDNTWTLSDDSASYGLGSSYLDEPYGNTVIFAHARKSLFLNLKDLDIGDQIIVYGSNGTYEYEVDKIEKVLPEDIESIISRGGTNLTLFTCEGIGDEYRLLIKAKRNSINIFDSEEVI